MTYVVGGASITLVQYKYGGMETRSYQSIEELIADLLVSNGYALCKKVEDEILPQAKEKWNEGNV